MLYGGLTLPHACVISHSFSARRSSPHSTVYTNNHGEQILSGTFAQNANPHFVYKTRVFNSMLRSVAFKTVAENLCSRL